MSLLNFFVQQRKLWQTQSLDGKTADYLAGGQAALDQAETAFKATLIYNAHQRLANTQRKLEEVSYQLSLARNRIKALEVAITPEQVKAKLNFSLLTHHRGQAHSARKVLRKVVKVANHDQMRLTTKLREITEMVEQFLTNNRGHDHQETE